MSAEVLHGDCIELMRGMAPESVDAIVTDPPYGLEFMGMAWDRPWQNRGGNPAGAGMSSGGFASGNGYANRKTPSYGRAWQNKRCTICGHIASGGSPCVCANPEWVIETGDTAAPMRAFQEWSEEWARECLRVLKPGAHMLAFGGTRTWHRLAVAVEDAGFEIRDSIAWMHGQGFPKGKAQLKPAHEPVVVARKRTVEPRTGLLNIDAARVGTTGGSTQPSGMDHLNKTNAAQGYRPRAYVTGPAPIPAPSGRWPANVILDDVMAAALDEQSGDRKSHGGGIGQHTSGMTASFGGGRVSDDASYTDSGGVSRFFYVAKPTKRERPTVDGVSHPTVKPLKLMRYLVRLVTPEGGTILDPFAGSGTTVEAAIIEGFNVIGIERESEYLPLIQARIERVA